MVGVRSGSGKFQPGSTTLLKIHRVRTNFDKDVNQTLSTRWKTISTLRVLRVPYLRLSILEPLVHLPVYLKGTLTPKGIPEYGRRSVPAYCRPEKPSIHYFPKIKKKGPNFSQPVVGRNDVGLQEILPGDSRLFNYKWWSLMVL